MDTKATHPWLEYRDGFKYQLAKDYCILTEITGYTIDTSYIKLTEEGLLTLKCGYASDGSSGPTIDTRSTIRAPFVHDAIYWLIRNGHIDYAYKAYADKLMKRILIEDGMWKARAGWWYLGVKWKGADSLYPSKERPILRAP